MFKNNFSIQGRIRRLEWGLSIIIYYLIVFIIGFLLGYFGISDGVTYGLGTLYISIIPPTIWLFMQGAKRCMTRKFRLVSVDSVLWFMDVIGDGERRKSIWPKS